MTSFPTLLVPTDFSSTAEAALVHALGLAERMGARLCLCHVTVQEPLTPGDEELQAQWDDLLTRRLESARLRLEAFQEAAAPPVMAEARVVQGRSAARAITEVAGEISAEAIVMGTHGRAGLSRLVVGSVAEGVVRSAPCPVLTVKHPDGVPYRHVLLTMDFSEASRSAVGLAAGLAAAYDARLSLLHVVEPRVSPGELAGLPDFAGDPAELAERAAEEMDRLVAGLAISSEVFIRRGDSVEAITSLILEKGVDCVVMTTHARSGLDRWLLGSVTEGVLRAVACPVLTCRGTEGCRMPSLAAPRGATQA